MTDGPWSEELTLWRVVDVWRESVNKRDERQLASDGFERRTFVPLSDAERRNQEAFSDGITEGHLDYSEQTKKAISDAERLREERDEALAACGEWNVEVKRLREALDITVTSIRTVAAKNPNHPDTPALRELADLIEARAALSQPGLSEGTGGVIEASGNPQRARHPRTVPSPLAESDQPVSKRCPACNGKKDAPNDSGSWVVGNGLCEHPFHSQPVSNEEGSDREKYRRFLRGVSNEEEK